MEIVSDTEKHNVNNSENSDFTDVYLKTYKYTKTFFKQRIWFVKRKINIRILKIDLTEKVNNAN